MTVCIAAICSDLPEKPGDRSQLYVVCASDRMLTAGVGGNADIEYEPTGIPKILPITNSIAILHAGDEFVQGEILQRLSREVGERITADQAKWWGVREVAERYCKHWDDVFHERANQRVFVRYGFTHEEFASNNRHLAPATISSVLQDMQKFQAEYPGVEAIFAGFDPTGPHIYATLENEIYSHDPFYYAAIGVGARHASSQFMLARHSFRKSLAETVRLAYFAKKRSEVAPGVGHLTDMCLIGPTLGSLEGFDQENHIKPLQLLYKASLKDEEKLRLKSQAGINKFVAALKRPPEGQASGPISLSASSGARASDTASATVTGKDDTIGPTGPTGPTGQR